ncbi:uncharacterized protein LOC124815304 isoform X2 [Hydra vulgaris]|uniref:uncharacterized protein LOC124815304 isoform X2 n=1 Tax=Hydra vulgaris TaxID=6087 RepID=UPI0032EA5563
MNVKLVLRRMIYSDGMNPLKHSVIFVITFFFFINTMTTTSLFSYLPKLVKSFGASEVQAGEDAGLIGSSLFFSRIFSSLLWGYFADKYGNKKLLFLSSICIAISTLAFAFSRSFTWAFVTKLLQGAAMGVVIITKSIVVDVCDDTNVSLAFSILFTGYHLGEVIGPSLSAILVFPAEQYPNAFSKESFFGEYKIFLPNLLISISFVIAIVWGYFTIPESKNALKPEEICLINEDITEVNTDGEKEHCFMNHPLNTNDYKTAENPALLPENQIVKHLLHKLHLMLKNSSFIRILSSKESLLSVMLYGLYGVVGIGIEEIIPVFLATSKDYGGAAMTVFDIGIMLLVSSILFIIAQFSTSKLQYRLGAKTTFVGCIFIFACATPLLPCSTLPQNNKLRWVLLLIIQVLINVVNNACFICVNIFLGNSVEHDLLGTVNGLGMSVSCIGRALGPTIFGFSFSWSLSNIDQHKFGFPFNQFFVFFLISIGCLLTCAYVYWFIPSTLNKRKVLPEKS